MSTRLQTFQLYATAVDALRTYFGDQHEALVGGESPSQYELSTEIEAFAWLKEDLPPLAASLLPARFRLRLTLTVHDFQAVLRIHGVAAQLEVDCESAGHLEGEPLGPLPAEAVEAFEALQNMLQAGIAGLPVGEVYNLLEVLAAGGATVGLSLQVFVDKNWINRRLVTDVNKNERPKVVSFLFPEALLVTLQRMSLASFEEEFCQYGRRTVIPVFGFSGCLNSDILSICGRGHESKLDAFLTKPLPDEVFQRAKKSLDFRQSQSLWVFPTTWLTPDVFALTAEPPAENSMGAEVCRQLKSFQALLSAIFLADYVEFHDNQYWVEYRGLGRARLPVQRTTLLEHEPHLEALYQLYVYAYDGFSADKLEIAQQFSSLIAVNLAALCDRAAEIRDATKKTYDRALVEKVKDYFDARHKIQERIKTAVGETASSVIGLTRDVSADLYKISGVVAGAVASALLKPDLSLWAALGASLVIAVYMSLVIFYHLATLKRAYDIRMSQHSAYIQSFKDILRTAEIQAFLSDEHLGKAQVMFSEKCKWAMAIYAAFLTIAVIFGTISVYRLFGLASSVSLPVPTPTP